MQKRHEPGGPEADDDKKAENPKAVQEPFPGRLFAGNGKYHRGKKSEQQRRCEVREQHGYPQGRALSPTLILIAHGNVIRIQDAEHVQQARHQQKLGAVIGQWRSRDGHVVAEKSGAEKEQTRTEVAEEPQGFH